MSVTVVAATTALRVFSVFLVALMHSRLTSPCPAPRPVPTLPLSRVAAHLRPDARTSAAAAHGLAVPAPRVGVAALLGLAIASRAGVVAPVRPPHLLALGGALAPTSPLGRLLPLLPSAPVVDPAVDPLLA